MAEKDPRERMAYTRAQQDFLCAVGEELSEAICPPVPFEAALPQT